VGPRRCRCVCERNKNRTKPLLTGPTSLEMVIIPVAVEKLVFSEKPRKTGDRKCLGDSGKSFVELPDAI
jgi:hypothetical protein